ncbi:hypothetical protein [Buttiauxella gaviniae]|jgi:hypothetical protein|uniref:hypothetical protein n=1 Tax=Buttiauxella gaviniae TaxID=82990 RepID=UPI003C788953
MNQIGERKKQLILILSGVTGWLTVAVLTCIVTSLWSYKERVVSAEQNAANWKRQAGKAYTSYLKASATSDNPAFSIPAGSIINCKIKVSLEKQHEVDCKHGIIYPPSDF